MKYEKNKVVNQPRHQQQSSILFLTLILGPVSPRLLVKVLMGLSQGESQRGFNATKTFSFVTDAAEK